MSGVFDFCPDSHVPEEIPPAEPEAFSFNGWQFTSKPVVPYRPQFRLKMHGMRWYLTETPKLDPVTGLPVLDPGGNPVMVEVLDLTTNPGFNFGRLRAFYLANRLWDTFTYSHQYLGDITCRFAQPLPMPPGLPDAGGLIEAFDVTLVHHNPTFS